MFLHSAMLNWGGRALLKRPTLRPASVMEKETRPTRYLAVLGKWALYGSKCTVCYGWGGGQNGSFCVDRGKTKETTAMRNTLRC